jgi:superfamily II DNA/RNA helicase
VHADPPAEHKAYLHRSGRTARAGNTGTVVTLMTSEQVRDVRDLTRAAGIRPTTTRIAGSAHPVLAELAPGERVLHRGLQPAAAPAVPRPSSAGGRNRSGGRTRRSTPRRGSGRSRSGTPSGGHNAARFSAGQR